MARLLAVISLFVFATPPSVAAPAATQPSLASSDRAADDAMQRLFDAVAVVPVDADGVRRSVAAVLAGSPSAEQELRNSILAAAQLGRPRESSPGVVAVDAWIATEKLQELLREAIAKSTSASSVRELAMPPSTPGSVTVTGQFADDGEARDSRPGWRHCTLSDINASLKAAETDLRQRVLSVLLQVPLSSGQTVARAVRERPELDRLLRSRLTQLKCGDAQYEPTGLCVLACSIGPEQAAAMVREAFNQAGLDTQSEFAPVVTASPSVLVTGFGTAPPRALARAAQGRLGPAPGWAKDVLSKTASARAPAETQNVEARNAMAVQAARIEARRQLWLAIENITLPNGRSIGTELTARPDRDRLIDAIDAAIFTMSTPAITDEGTASVTLGVRLEAVWLAVQ